MSDRDAFRANRNAGLQKRHEQRLENATYTAAEVKVLTEAALRLGRKEAGEEIAQACEAEYRPIVNVGGPEPIPSDPTEWDEALHVAVIIAREIGARPSPDATSGRTDPKVDSGLPQDSQGLRDRNLGEGDTA